MGDVPARILFYSHDGHGLGHLRMTLVLARALARREPKAAIVIATGAQDLETSRLPEQIELVKLPSSRAAAALGEIGPAAGSGYSWRGVWAMREALLHEVARTFDPHLVVGDNEPAGLAGELARTLRLVRARSPRARTALGMNDCLGDGESVVRRWRREGGLDALAGDYDRVLVFGQSDVFDPRTAYDFPPVAAERTRFCGYLWPGPPAADWGRTRAAHGVAADERWVVVAAGGGEDGQRLMSVACEAAELGRVDARWLLVAGPLMPATARMELSERAARLERVALVTAIDDLPSVFAAADTVAIMGGYNSVVEAVGAGKRPIVVPRDDAWTEQRQRAERFAELGLAVSIRPTALTAESLSEAIGERLAAHVSPPAILDLGGVERAVDELAGLLPVPSERWPARALAAARLPARSVASPPPVALMTAAERVVAAWDGTRFHVRSGDLIEEEIARRGAFEIDVQRVLFPWLRPGDVVIDAGANIGCHACPMAIRVAPGLVLAIEPVGRLADRLEANCRINALENVVVARVAVSSESGRRRLVVPPIDDENQGAASFHREPFPAGSAIDLETTTIDALAAVHGIGRVRLIKLDLEGEEVAALLGARETLRRWRPIVAFEHHPALWERAGRALADADRLLAGELGYRLSPLPARDEVRTILAIH